MNQVKRMLRPLYVPLAHWYYDRFKAPKRYHHLFDSIKHLNATKILEVGTWNGNRAVAMIKTAQEVSPESEVEYYGFDLFEDLTDDLYVQEISKKPPGKEEVEQKLKETGAKIYLYQGNTLETLPRAVAELPNVDFVFIDGGHSYETIKSDWEAVAQLMHKQTVVIFDDYWRNRTDHGAKPVVDAIDTNFFDVQILSEIDVSNNTDFGRLEISFARVTLR